MPAEIMQIRRRDETLKWARVRGFVHTLGAVRGGLAQIRKDQIEIIKQIEVRLNIPPEMIKKVEFKIGQRVRFLNDLYVAFLGEATVFEVASDHRIGISGPMLFGSAIKIYVPASEIEAV